MATVGTFVHGFQDAALCSKMTYRSLRGKDVEPWLVSALGFGASALGSVFGATTLDESVQVVRTALRSGVNYIDTAPWYGQGKSEEVLGHALEGIPRHAYYVATKVGRYSPEITKMFDFSRDRTLRSIEESLKLLKLDYVDVLQIHDLEFAPSMKVLLSETIPALLDIKKRGLAKRIGLTGYPIPVLRDILLKCSADIDQVLTYCHYSLNDTSLISFLPFVKEHGLGLVSAAPLSMGLLTAQGPPVWHPASLEIKDACKKAAKYCKEEGVDLATVALKFSLQLSEVPTTLVSTASLSQLNQNLNAAREPLTPIEQRVALHVMENYFSPLTVKTWDGVTPYRNALAKALET